MYRRYLFYRALGYRRVVAYRLATRMFSYA